MTIEKDDQDVAPESSFDKFIRDEQGRFAKAEENEPAPPAAPAPTPQSDAPPAPPPTASPAPVTPDPAPASQPKPDGHIPIAALLDEREKRKELERRLREFEEKQQKQDTPIPDPIADPEGYNARLEEQRTRDKQDLIFRFSEQFAARQHGADVVKQAMEWLGQELQSNPALWPVISSHADPAEHVVQLHKRHLRFAKLGDKDPDEYAREIAVARRDEFLQLLGQQGAPAAAPSPQPPKPPPPRPSIASAPAAAPVAAQDHAYNEAEIFKGLFGKK